HQSVFEGDEVDTTLAAEGEMSVGNDQHSFHDENAQAELCGHGLMPYCKLSWTSSSSLQKISTQSDWRRDDKISSTLSQNGKFNESNCDTIINVDKGIHIPYDTNLLSDDVRVESFSSQNKEVG
ncbi:hypothetical protein RRG08_055170, partial [Elysia crispata]